MCNQDKIRSVWTILRATLIIGLVVLGGVVLVSAGGIYQSREQACNRTSQAAFRACLYEITDDFWIAVGNCTNLSDTGAR